MSDLYARVSWFRDLARRIADGGKEYLADRVPKVDWKKRRPPAVVQMGLALSASPDALLDQIRKLAMRIRGAAAAVHFHAV